MDNVSLKVVESFGGEKTKDVLAIIGDAGLNAALSSDALGGVPVIGAIYGLFKAGKEVRHELYVRQIARFLSGLSSTTEDERAIFIDSLNERGKSEKFGEAILILLDKVDDIVKPVIIGRIMAAHIKGHLDYDKAMRLSHMVNKSYGKDLDHLKNFHNGTQGRMAIVAESLCSIGFLSNNGVDGGRFSDPEAGGIIYGMNEYGEALVKFGLA